MGKFLHAFFSPLDFLRAVPQVWDGFQTNIKLMVIAEALVLVLRARCSQSSAACRDARASRSARSRSSTRTSSAARRSSSSSSSSASASRRSTSPVISDQSLFVYGIVSLTLVYTAYVTEVYRAGIESVHPSQRMAARSLGLTYTQALRFVVLPQAIRRVIPPLLNDFIGLQKDTALITVLGLTEAAAQAGFYSTDYFNYAGFTVAAVFFIILTIPLARFTDHLIKEREQRERAQAV